MWAWGDLMNALQVFPNLIGVIGLSGIVARIRGVGRSLGQLRQVADYQLSPLDRRRKGCYYRTRNSFGFKGFR